MRRDSRINLRALREGAVRIDVTDDGEGLPEAMRARALEPVGNVDPSRGGQSGFGRGFSIVEEVVRRHGGTQKLDARSAWSLATLVPPAG